MTFAGVKTRDPLGPPTSMTCVLTMPMPAIPPVIPPVGAASAGAADAEARVSEGVAISPACVVAVASPRRAEAMKDLEKNILLVCGVVERAFVNY